MSFLPLLSRATPNLVKKILPLKPFPTQDISFPIQDIANLTIFNLLTGTPKPTSYEDSYNWGRVSYNEEVDVIEFRTP